MKKTTFLLAALAFSSACSTPWTLADLRTDVVKSRGDDAALRQQGRALLEAVAVAHGLDAWRAHQTLEVTAVDDWDAHLLGPALSWWLPPVQRLRQRMLSGTFTSQIELLDGPEAGAVLGIQGWRTYRADAGELRLTDDDERTRFYLPTLQYFAELPFRLLDADVVVHAGEAVFAGRRYERLLVSWQSPAPHAEHDQYDLWVDPETRRIASCRYTLREAFPAATGTIFFEDYRETDGVLLPYRQTVMLAAHSDLEEVPRDGWLHRLVVEDAAFDRFPPDSLRPLKDVTPMAGKPSLAATP